MANKGIKAGKWEYSESELKQMDREAKLRGKQKDATEPRAIAAHYDRKSCRLVVDLSNGATVMLPVSLLQGFEKANPRDIAAVEVSAAGRALHWEKLDADFGVPGLIAGGFGNKTWMAELGRTGGKVSSAAKAAAARANGAKGGRPRLDKAAKGSARR